MDFSGMTKKEVLDAWDEETDMARRDLILEELQRRKLFPSNYEYMYEMTTGAYPDSAITKDRGQYLARDPEFLQKLMARREFAESIQHDWELPSDPCDLGRGFEVTPVQRFVANFMSPKSPYMSALLYHGVGVGKTCGALQIAENWLSNFPNKRVIVVAPGVIQEGFRTELFDIARMRFGATKTEPNHLSGCTSSYYLELSDSLYIQPDPNARDLVEEEAATRKRIQKRVTKQIDKRYEFYGYLSFANYIITLIKPSQRIVDKVAREIDEKQRINAIFDGTLLIIDEAHNLREISDEQQTNTPDEDSDSPEGSESAKQSSEGKVLTPFLNMVLKYTTGLKLVLMTATPMYNSFAEIIFLLNLLLKNDGQAELKFSDIFADKDGAFRENGEKVLGLVASRYISFMRGENPQSFPLRLYPLDREPLEDYPTRNPSGGHVDMDETDFMDKLPIVPTELSGDSLRAVQYFSGRLKKSKGISSFNLEKIVQAGNIIVPLPEDMEDNEATLAKRVSIRALDMHFDKRSEDKITSWYPRNKDSADWLAEDNLAEYSPKYHKVLKYIRKAEGVCFLYTRYIQAGALPLALALEANGYTPYGRKTGYLAGGPVTPGGRQCALCESREAAHKDIADHKFVSAKFILLTGDKTISPNNKNMIKAEKSADNVNGSRVKIVIGSSVAAEGVDLKFVREVHVLDSWYHLNKIEQIIGRGIRFRSHCALPEEKRNTTIYLHAAVRPEEDNRESGDLYSYRVSYRKGRQAGRITRVLKQYAIDCNLNHDAIIIANANPMEQVIDSQNNVREDVPINDMPFTAVCDWLEDCDYQCAEPLAIEPSTTLDISYDEYAAKWRENELKIRLRRLFEKQAFYSLQKLTEKLFVDVPKVAQSELLYKIVGNKSFSVTHNGRDGYIIYKNGYYLFQPMNFIDINVPLALRIAAYPVKVERYEPRDIYTEITQRIKAKRQAAVLALEEGDEEGAAAAEREAEGEEGEDADLIAATAPKKELGRTLEELLELWRFYEEWATKLASYDSLRKINAVMYAKAIGDFIQERANDEAKEEERLMQRYEVIQWFAGACIPWTEEKRGFFIKAVMELVWDEEFNDEDRETLLFERESMPETMAAAARHNHFRTKSDSIVRLISADENVLKYYCNGRTLCAPAKIALFEPMVKKGEAPKKTDDPLSTLVVNKDNTGQLYGFITNEKGMYVYKSHRPGKTGSGEKCDNVSNMKKHREKVVELGEVLAEVVREDYQLTEEILDKSTRKVVNPKRMCMLLNLVLRYMDVMGVQKKRWFYRPIEARKVGHLGKP
jgi:hypothetical protein